AYLSGIDETALLGFGAMGKKANMGGDEMGTAFRAVTKNLQAPTREGREAMMSAGINYNDYVRAPKAMNSEGFAKLVAQEYGVNLNPAARARLGRIFADPSLTSDPSRFNPAVQSALNETLGGKDAKSKRSIAGLAGRYLQDSAGGVDANSLLKA